jgi:hypothetical protein
MTIGHSVGYMERAGDRAGGGSRRALPDRKGAIHGRPTLARSHYIMNCFGGMRYTLARGNWDETARGVGQGSGRAEEQFPTSRI